MHLENGAENQIEPGVFADLFFEERTRLICCKFREHNNCYIEKTIQTIQSDMYGTRLHLGQIDTQIIEWHPQPHRLNGLTVCLNIVEKQ